MEIVSHALWAAAAGTAAARVAAPRLHLGWLAFWAMFPDLFAFTPHVGARLWARLTGAPWVHVHHSGGVDLYSLSHSLVVFAPVFALACLVFRKPQWALLGWALHIAMDIPTHSEHYPTPFLWPVSGYRFIGIAWHQWWFEVLCYTALAAVFLLLRRRKGADHAGPACD